MKIYLTYAQFTRLWAWLTKNYIECKRVTGKNPLKYFASAVAGVDLQGLPYTHVLWPRDVELWMKKNCPYGYVTDNIEGRRFFRFTRTRKS